MKLFNGTFLLENERLSFENGLPAIALSAALVMGTGSTSNAPAAVNGTSLYATVVDSSHEIVPLAASSLRSILHDIRSNFEFSTVDLASVLGVSRQTLYDWSAERAEPRIDRQRRLRELQALSSQWRAAVGSRIDTVNHKFSDKPALIAIVSDTSLSAAVKSQRMENLARQRQVITNSPSINDRLKKLGFKRDAGMQQRVLDEQGW